MTKSMPRMTRIDSLATRLVYLSRGPVLGRLIYPLLELLGVQIPRQVTVGPGLTLSHCTAGLVVHARTQIGADVTLLHNVTIGRADAADPTRDEIPGCIIKDGAVICAGAVILTPPREHLVIGEGAVIGANAVVTRSVPAGETWVGNPARPVRRRVSADAD